MFTFFHKTPKIHLDCFTANAPAYKYVPIVKASKTIPEWWKKLPRHRPKFDHSKDFSDITRGKNMRTCYGFLDFYKRGVVIENWADLSVKVTEESYTYFYSNGAEPKQHPRHQYGEGFKKWHHMKLVSPWWFRETSGKPFIFVGADYCLEDYLFKVLPGVVEFKMNHATNPNCMIPAMVHQFEIPIGAPLLHIIPMVEGELIIRNHLVSLEEIKNIQTNTGASFFGWRSIDKLIKRNETRKCPFGFDQ